MRNRPRLSVTCGRCGQPRTGIRHDCIVTSGRAARRKPTVKVKVGFGKCETCKKPLGNPLTHVCTPRSDFKKRKRAAAQGAERRRKEQARAVRSALAKAKRDASPKHEYQSCKDDDCKRSACVAYKTGWREGHEDGFEEGWAAGFGAGYSEGFQAGRESCPGPHGGG